MNQGLQTNRVIFRLNEILARYLRKGTEIGAFLAPSCLTSPPQWLIDMRKCPTISPDVIANHFVTVY